MQLFSWFIQANNNKVKAILPQNPLITSNKTQNCNMWPMAIVRQPPLEKQALFVTTTKNEKEKHALLKPIKLLSADLEHS